MSLFQAFVLGLVQGLGEFLPISSSGHLIVTPWLLGWPEHGLAFDVSLHIGTLAAVLWMFAPEWWRLVTAALRGLRAGQPFADRDARLLWLIALATVPGVIAGLLLDDWAETTFRAAPLVAFDMAVMGAVLLVADGRARTTAVGDVSVRDALLIGIAQAFAIVPGVSRSGATISMALFLGYSRDEAARFSFLLALPITLGAALVKAPQLLGAGAGAPVLVGILTAGLSGALAIRVLLAYVRTRTYRPFVYYRWAFALVVFAVWALRG